jgi:hypothetical protein
MPSKANAANEGLKTFSRSTGLKYYVGAHVGTTDGEYRSIRGQLKTCWSSNALRFLEHKTKHITAARRKTTTMAHSMRV